MFIFTTAKNNLLAKFKARFSLDPKGLGYLFFAREYDQGYSCSETDYLKFTSDFQKFLKWMTRIMWLWFLVGMPLIIGFAVWQDYDFSTLEKIVIIIFPLPILAIRGWKVYNAPNVLMAGKRPSANRRNQKQIFESRIKGMSWLMLIALTIVPLIGSYVFLKDSGLKDWQVALGLCCFTTIFVFGIYMILRKWRIYAKEKHQG